MQGLPRPYSALEMRPSGRRIAAGLLHALASPPPLVLAGQNGKIGTEPATALAIRSALKIDGRHGMASRAAADGISKCWTLPVPPLPATS